MPLALVKAGLSTPNNRETTTHKAALSTKKPRSAPGFVVRVQQSRSGFFKATRHCQS
jgi:hypothetical protein